MILNSADKTTNEKPIQDFYVKILVACNIPFIRIKNSAFNKKSNNYKDALGERCDKNLADLIFTYNNIYYHRELGIEGHNNARKKKQREKMAWFKRISPRATDIKIITSMEGAWQDLKKIGLIKNV